MKIWNNRESIDTDGNIVAYLFAAVKNKSFETIRKHKNDIQKLQNIRFEASQEPSNVAQAEIDQFLLKEKLNNSIRQLPTKCRDIFVLSKVDGLTYNEIAELRKISKKTVENHMSNALKILRKLLR